ncbi:hypothetical protein ACHWQZ_G001422 [Mnemiopsis leidyi]
MSGVSAVCPARNVRPSSSASAINYPHGPLINVSFVVLIHSEFWTDNMIIFLNILVNATMQISGALASAILYSR